ncbi:MAG: glutamine--fructose-6-phosphate aminotransferase, partial [Microbacteriaceae bacterium]|nr:glutamine--fructose-6-phosphate aminotransferase [Microbacteriaceae bacterium]
MCGIVGYVGQRSASEVVLGGLARLEYRGYDSAGIAIVVPGNSLVSHKKAGKLSVLRDELEANPLAQGTTGIGHTRWATHGPPTDANA